MRWGLSEKFGVVFSFAVVVTATESLKQLMAESSSTFTSYLTSGTTDSLDQAALILRDSILHSLHLHIPHSNPCSRSKRWWTDELATLRQEMARMHRK